MYATMAAAAPGQISFSAPDIDRAGLRDLSVFEIEFIHGGRIVWRDVGHAAFVGFFGGLGGGLGALGGSALGGPIGGVAGGAFGAAAGGAAGELLFQAIF